jgi:hypothetical protein
VTDYRSVPDSVLPFRLFRQIISCDHDSTDGKEDPAPWVLQDLFRHFFHQFNTLVNCPAVTRYRLHRLNDLLKNPTYSINRKIDRMHLFPGCSDTAKRLTLAGLESDTPVLMADKGPKSDDRWTIRLQVFPLKRATDTPVDYCPHLHHHGELLEAGV